MTNDLAEVLNGIAAEYEGEINPKSDLYSLVDIGKAAQALGKPELFDRYEGVRAVLPLRRRRGSGLAIAVNGLGFADYVQLESGLAVEEYVAKEADLESTPY